MSDDTNLDNRLAQGRWESVHANDFARMDTPEQRIGFLKELLGNLKKDIGEAKGRPRAVTAEDARILAEGERYLELKHCGDPEGLLARLEQESNTPELSSSENRDLMRNSRQTWQRTFEPKLRVQLQTEGPELPEDDQRKIIEDKRQEYSIAQCRKALEAKQEKTKQMLELAPRYWAAQDRQREDEQAWQMSHRLEADQRLLITMLGKERREESHASPPPQPLSEEAPEPEDTQDRQEIPVAEVEKIDFNGSVSQLVYFWELLYEVDRGFSKSQYERRWSLLAKHFTVKGRPLKASVLKSTASKITNNKTKKPRGHEGFKVLVQLLEKLPEAAEAFLSENQ